MILIVINIAIKRVSMFVIILVNVIKSDIVASMIVTSTVLLSTKNNKSIINIDQIMIMIVIS